MIHKGILKAFDAPSYTATVQMIGSLGVWLYSVPVSRDIASGEMSAGRNVAIASLDPSNPNDYVVFAVWT